MPGRWPRTLDGLGLVAGRARTTMRCPCLFYQRWNPRQFAGGAGAAQAGRAARAALHRTVRPQRLPLGPGRPRGAPRHGRARRLAPRRPDALRAARDDGAAALRQGAPPRRASRRRNGCQRRAGRPAGAAQEAEDPPSPAPVRSRDGRRSRGAGRDPAARPGTRGDGERTPRRRGGPPVTSTSGLRIPRSSGTGSRRPCRSPDRGDAVFIHEKRALWPYWRAMQPFWTQDKDRFRLLDYSTRQLVRLLPVVRPADEPASRTRRSASSTRRPRGASSTGSSPTRACSPIPTT